MTHPSEATSDTPQEREEKAAVLAREVKRFRWEIRTYYIALFVYLVIREVT